jgi:hypothetical protein
MATGSLGGTQWGIYKPGGKYMNTHKGWLKSWQIEISKLNNSQLMMAESWLDRLLEWGFCDRSYDMYELLFCIGEEREIRDRKALDKSREKILKKLRF